MRKLALIAVLMLATLASAQTRPITFEDLAAVRRIGAPKLSPDGKWIAYDVSTIDLPGNIRKSAIHLMRADGTGPKQITTGAKQDEGPEWSPDGKTIAYVSNRDGKGKQIW